MEWSFKTIATPAQFAALTLLLPFQPSAFAQNSAGLIAQNPRAQYEVIRQVANERTFVFANASMANEPVLLSLCGDEYEDAGNLLTARLTMIAYQVAKASQNLEQANYPRAVWEGNLSILERAELARVIDRGQNPELYDTPAVRTLVSQLETYRRANPSLPEINWMPCGGPGIAVKFKTIPASGDVWVLPSFFYSLCQRQKLNPDDRDQCNHGREYADGIETSLLGAYRYVARWSNGASKRGILSFDDNISGQGVPCVREMKDWPVECLELTISAGQ